MIFTRTKKTGLISGQPEVHFEEATAGDSFAVVATAEGVRLKGISPYFTNHEDLTALAKTIGNAIGEHHALSKHVRSSLIIPDGRS